MTIAAGSFMQQAHAPIDQRSERADRQDLDDEASIVQNIAEGLAGRTANPRGLPITPRSAIDSDDPNNASRFKRKSDAPA